MVDFVVFNELSLPFTNQTKIKKKFKDFFSIFNELEKRNITKIRMDKNFKDYPILENKSLQQFFGQLSDIELKDRLREFITNGIVKIDSPLIMHNEEESEQLLESEYFYNKISTQGGLACADVWNTLAISFNSDEEWNNYKIILQKETISDEEKVNIEILHLSKKEHIEEDTLKDFFNELEDFIKLGITQNNFWEKREEFFPKRIVFCKEVEKQIKTLDKHIFRQAIRILRDIENNQESIPKNKYTPESPSVKNNTKKSDKRMFTINNKKVYFDNHITFSSQKIYFLEQDDKIYIGYIGKHLPTKKY